MTKRDEIELAIRRAMHPNDCPHCGNPMAPEGRLMALAVGYCGAHWKNGHMNNQLECDTRREKRLTELGLTDVPEDCA